jgi:hypothetical protein
MLDFFSKTVFSAVLIGILAVVSAVSAQSASQATITVTVTALASNFKPAPEIPQEDVTAFSGSTRLNVTRWTRAQANGEDLQLAILIDNDLSSSLLGRQMQDIRNYISSEPAGESIGVFYAENGAATESAPFTTDHAATAKAVHLTAGSAGGSPSIYLSLSDLVSHWPSSGAPRRELLVIASGYDPLNPGVQDPYADSAVNAAEKAGVGVHIILIPNPRYESTFGDNISEGKLIEASKGTGGQVLFEGNSSPISLAPFLTELRSTLSNQYLLTFTIDRSPKEEGELRPFRVRTEEHGVKLYAPENILVPGS